MSTSFQKVSLKAGSEYTARRLSARTNSQGEINIQEHIILPSTALSVGWAVNVVEGSADKPIVGDAWLRVDHFRYASAGPVTIVGDTQWNFWLDIQAYYKNQQELKSPNRYTRALNITVTLFVPLK